MLFKNNKEFTPAMLNMGWAELSRFSFLNFTALLLTKSNGDSAYWVFKDRNYIGNQLNKLNGLEKSNVIISFIRVLLSPSDYILKKNILLYEYCSFFKDLELVAKSKEFENNFVSSFDQTFRYDSCASVLSRISGRDFQDSLAESRTLIIDDESLRFKFSFVVSDFETVYLSLYKNKSILVFETGHYTKIAALVGIEDLSSKLNCDLNVFLKLMIRFKNHLFSYLKKIALYLMSEPVLISGSIRNSHMGHNLWNDLSGLDRILKNKFIGNYSEIYTFHGVFQDAWIPIERFIHTNSESINIDNRPEVYNINKSDLCSRTYVNGFFHIRINDNYISQDLVDKIINYNFAKLDCTNNLSLSDGCYDVNICIGLRFENRTWVNQLDDFELLLKSIMDNLSGKVRVFIDGHDLLPGNVTLRSHGEVDNAALENEIRLFSLLIESLKSGLLSLYSERLFVFSLVNTPIEYTLFNLSKIDFFIAPWGAGLSKYKWILNKPGLVFTSDVVIKNSNYKIYEHVKYRENARECVYVAQDYITSHGSDKQSNFFLNVNGVVEALNSLTFEIEGSGDEF